MLGCREHQLAKVSSWEELAGRAGAGSSAESRRMVRSMRSLCKVAYVSPCSFNCSPACIRSVCRFPANRTTKAPSTDAIASKSTFLASYMSQHVDTLVAYIIFYLQSKSWAGGASAKEKKEAGGLAAKDVRDTTMLSISSRNMVLQYRDARQGKKAELKQVRKPDRRGMTGEADNSAASSSINESSPSHLTLLC